MRQSSVAPVASPLSLPVATPAEFAPSQLRMTRRHFALQVMPLARGAVSPASGSRRFVLAPGHSSARSKTPAKPPRELRFSSIAMRSRFRHRPGRIGRRADRQHALIRMPARLAVHRDDALTAASLSMIVSSCLDVAVATDQPVTALAVTTRTAVILATAPTTVLAAAAAAAAPARRPAMQGAAALCSAASQVLLIANGPRAKDAVVALHRRGAVMVQGEVAAGGET